VNVILRIDGPNIRAFFLVLFFYVVDFILDNYRLRSAT